MNILAFDIETIPDVESGRKLYSLDGLSDKDAARVMFAKRREQTGESDFLRHYLHRVATISAVWRNADTLKIWSLGDANASEAELIQRFFDGIEKFTPVLVSWNGGGFDLPVLHYRALKHGISAPRYWDVGESDRDFKWNNYIGRYHWRHTDLMDVISGYQPRAVAPLDDLSLVLGLPGKMGRSGAEVWDQYLDGKIGEIRDYCETDALNTYLIYLRFELMRGNLDAASHERELALVRETLRSSGRAHLQAYLRAWTGAPAA